MKRSLCSGLLLVGAVAACSASQTNAAPSADDADGGAAMACSDGAIADVLAAEERAHIDLAMAVRDRLQSPDVVAFAEKEITDHTLLSLELDGAARADGIAFAPDDEADALTQATQFAVLSLQGTTGAALDRAYLARAVLAHAQDAAVQDALLAPAAHDTRIVDDIQRRRPQLAEHQSLAIDLQKRLGASCGSQSGVPTVPGEAGVGGG